MLRTRILLAPACAVAAMMALSTLPAAAQTFEGEGATGLLEGLGVIEGPKDKIEIRERAPLVIPGTASLPQPQATSARPGARPDWPNDPDEQRRAEQKVIDQWKEQAARGGALSASEMRGNTATTTRQKANPNDQMGIKDRAPVTMAPSKLASGHKLLNKEDSWADAEPQRRVLTDPPVGYRAPSSGAAYAPAPNRRSGVSEFLDKINPFSD
jgi:hypothetical protein